MLLPRGRLVPAAIILLIIMAGLLLTINSMGETPGIYLGLKLYEVNAEKNEVVDVSYLLDDPSTRMYIEVEAIAPPGSGRDFVLLYKSYVKAARNGFIPLEGLLEVARKWVSTIQERGGRVDKTFSGLVIRIMIVNQSTGEFLFQAYDSISYMPAEIVGGKSLSITLHLSSGSMKPVLVESQYASSPSKAPGFIQVAGAEPIGGSPYRELVLEITPEKIISQLPSSYFQNVSGRVFVRTPVLIVSNKYTISGTISASINIDTGSGRVGIYPSFTSGEILNKILNGVAPSVTLWKGSGFTWGGGYYSFGYSNIIPPSTDWWVWIWARPVLRVFKVYNSLGVYVGDDVEAVVVDVYTTGLSINGGAEYGLPHQSLMDMFLSGTELRQLYIPETHASDGALSPGEFITLKHVFGHYDSCGTNFEIGIPAGSIAARGVCALLGLPTGGAACVAATAFASALQLSISVEGESTTVQGNLVNHGDHPLVENDYNVAEHVYIRTGKYQYKVDPPWWCFWCSPCYYRVPAGIYFEFG